MDTWYSTVCQQTLLVALFGIIFNVIYATDCSFACIAVVDILSDARKTCLASACNDMEINTEDVIRICENPLRSEKNFDVIWKRKETLVDYRARRKTTSVEHKLKTYDDEATGKTESDNKLKDRPIDYTYIDEYCKVSAPKPSDEEACRPRDLKTNTAFGRSKMPFHKFARLHTGGGTVDYTLNEPLAQAVKCHQVNTGIKNAEASCDTAPVYYETDDLPLRYCGHNVETAIDYCTCMFCVKGLFYHCTKDSCPENAPEDPCACNSINMGCCARWSLLGVISLLFPCLLCYPLTRGCAEVCKCYKQGENLKKDRRNRTIQNLEQQRLT